MSTTELLIEHLITGIQTAIWVGLLSFTFSGLDNGLIEFLKANETVVLFLTMALIYPLGLFVDNLSDKLLDGWDERIKAQMYKAKDEHIDVNDLNVSKLLIYANDEGLVNLYTYIRMRIRISRSSFFNFGMIIISGSLFLFFRFPEQLHPVNSWVIAALLASLLIMGLALWSWYNITKGYHTRTAKTYLILKDMGKIE